MGAHVETAFFESRKAQLIARHPGRFAVISGEQLCAVCLTLDDALSLVAADFAEGRLAEGATVLITEIAETPQVQLRAGAGAEPPARFATP